MTTSKKIEYDMFLKMCFKKDNYQQLTKREIMLLNELFFDVFLYDIEYKTTLFKFNYNVTNMLKHCWLNKQTEEPLKPKEIEGLVKVVDMFHLLVKKYAKI